MSKRFSLSALMHNRKAMIIFSLLAAIAIWGAVIYGGSADEERVLRVSVPVDLTGTYAEQIGMRIIGESTFDVQVRVQGRFSVISQLTAEDVRVRVDTGTIFRTGKQTLSVTASRNSAETDYTITSCFPNTVTVTCDYWDTGLSFKVGVDTGGVKVADESQHRLGDAIPDSSLLPDGSVTLEGPRSVTSQIASIVARISDSAAISETTVFSARTGRAGRRRQRGGSVRLPFHRPDLHDRQCDRSRLGIPHGGLLLRAAECARRAEKPQRSRDGVARIYRHRRSAVGCRHVC